MKNKNTQLFLNFAILISMMIFFQQQAKATASFARATGASCNKCHTATFPRLTTKGEKFMLNGYQMKKESDGGFGLDDDESPGKEDKKEKFSLTKLAEMLSITGQFNPIEMSSNNSTPSLGNPDVVTVIAAGNLMKDMPIWAGIDVESGGASVHRYQMGITNIGDSKLANIRMGTIDPTTWTSFYGHGAALESASSSIGSYGAGHDGDTGFVTVGSGYAERNAMEYYGYTKNLLWSLGLSNASNHDGGDANDPLDYWVTTRYQFMKKSTVSFLWYNANGAVENQTYTAAANLRLGNLDLLGQFSIDNTGTTTLRDKWGITGQANYTVSKKSMGILRYDATDNGEQAGSEEIQVTAALVFKPEQNIKITASYVMEVVSSGGVLAGDGHDHVHAKPGVRATNSLSKLSKVGPRAVATDPTATEKTAFGDHFKINIRYMF